MYRFKSAPFRCLYDVLNTNLARFIVYPPQFVGFTASDVSVRTGVD